MISRGEGKNTIAIALSQANPLVENVSVFLSSALYTLDTYVYANYIIRGLYPYSVSLYCIEFSLHNCSCHIEAPSSKARWYIDRYLITRPVDGEEKQQHQQPASWASPAILKIAFVMSMQRKFLMRRLFCVLDTDSTAGVARNTDTKQP